MRSAQCLVVALLGLALFAGTAFAKELSYYTEKVQQQLTRKNLTSMMDVTRLLKDAGASFQQALTAQPTLAERMKPGESLRVMVGVYQFDAVYAAAFGQKGKVVEALRAQNLVIDRLNLRGKIDLSAIFPNELNRMLKNPETATFSEIVDAYAKNASRFKDLMKEPVGFETIESSLYGFLLEGLYVITQAVMQMNYDPRLKSVLAAAERDMRMAIGIYATFDNDEDYAKYVDPESYNERGERLAWLSQIFDLIARKKGDLTKSEADSAARLIARKRAEIVPAK